MIISHKWYKNLETGEIDIGEVWCCEAYTPKLEEWDITKPVHSYISARVHGNKTATYIPISGRVLDRAFADATWQSPYFETEEEAAKAWENQDAFCMEHVE